MPFWYHIPVPTTPECRDQSILLVKWIVKEGDEFHAETQLAILETTSGWVEVVANGNGFIRERLFSIGAELKPGMPLAIANADGEEIPYGRPYSTAKCIEKPVNPQFQ